MKIFKDHIMVTGSNGFIGSNLIKTLSKNFSFMPIIEEKKI